MALPQVCLNVTLRDTSRHRGRVAADQIVAPPGVTVAELDVPTKFEKAKFEDFVHRLHVDVHKKQLAERT